MGKSEAVAMYGNNSLVDNLIIISFCKVKLICSTVTFPFFSARKVQELKEKRNLVKKNMSLHKYTYRYTHIFVCVCESWNLTSTKDSDLKYTTFAKSSP